MNQANHKTTKPQLINQSEPGLALPISESVAHSLMAKVTIKAMDRHSIKLSQSEIIVPTEGGARMISSYLLSVIAPDTSPSEAAGVAHLIRRAFNLPTEKWHRTHQRESIAMYCDAQLTK